jgi:alkanesulfonate monooxygenase SsuD/methylene tetrahydromethanopterin reductase-like flavin-dependent oxidoreductase (luciferase family)
MMLEELRAIVRSLDELGFNGFATTEHHFHTEGGEANPNTLLMFSHLASITERLQFIPTSIVLSVSDPIRVAEDVALFDQMYPGRVAVCFARGYQKRWLQVMAQDADITPFSSPTADGHNREVFNENLDIVLKAWTEDSFSYNGKHYQVPFPYDGIPGWPAPDWTRRFGNPGEIDDDGVIKEIGVIPRPHADPHPDIFVPFNGSPATLVNAAKRGFIPIITEGRTEQFLSTVRTYQETANESGRELGLGEHCGAVRVIAIGDSYDEAFDICARTAGYEWHNYFELFGGATEALRMPDDDPDSIVRFDSTEAMTQRLIDTRHAIVGTEDEVREKLVDLKNCYADGNLDWLVWEFFAQGTMPIAEQRRQLESFAKILPDLA